MAFSDTLENTVRKKKSHLVIGLDPDPKRLFDKDSGFQRIYPEKDRRYVLDAFSDLVIRVSQETACAIKPQAAFFESMGVLGWKALLRCIKKCRDIGLPVILDAKRGDIGNTAEAYAQSYLNPDSEFFCDALTVNPYLGPDSLLPFVEASNRYGSGVFILVKTSNPGSSHLQDLVTEDGHTVAAKIAQLVNQFAGSSRSQDGYSNIGAVIGATYPEDLKTLRGMLERSVILVPGFGAQGGTLETIKYAFSTGGKDSLKGAVVVSARSIIFAYEPLLRDSAAKMGPIVFWNQAEALVLDMAKKTRDAIETAILAPKTT